MAADADLDVIIIGGGPGGLSALLWCFELGLQAALFEKESEFGGQLLRTYNPIGNYLGLAAANGRDLRDMFLRHIEKVDARRFVDASVSSADLNKRKITLADGREFSARAVIIATGVRRRKLGIDGEDEFLGRGVLESGAGAKDEIDGKTVLIVGGGDAAFENALMLSEKAKKVIIVHRRDQFTARREFLRGAQGKPNIELIVNSRVAGILGDGCLRSVDVDGPGPGTRSSIAVDNVLIRIGVLPNTELFSGQFAPAADGYISIDENCSTAIEFVYAAGDVTNPISPTVSTAVGHGATAAKSAFWHLGGC